MYFFNVSFFPFSSLVRIFFGNWIHSFVNRYFCEYLQYGTLDQSRQRWMSGGTFERDTPSLVEFDNSSG